MAKIFLTDINLNGNKLQNVVVESINNVNTIAAAQCWTGRIVFDSNDSKFKYYNGTAWIAGALYEAANKNADVANVSYGVYDSATSGTGEDVGKTTLNFKSIAIAANNSLTISEAGGVITLGLSVDGATIGRDSSTYALKSLMTLKKLTTPAGDDAATYELQDANGNRIGDQINVTKDQFLYNAVIGTMGDTVDPATGVITTGTGNTALDLVFHLADGTYSLVKIDLQTFIEENEFSDGLVVDNHVVKVNIATAAQSAESAKYLKFGTPGSGNKYIEVSGIDAAIAEAAAEATTVVTGESAATGPAVKVTSSVDPTDGHTTYAVAGQDLASAAKLATVDGDDTTTGSFRKAIKDAKTIIDAYTVNTKAISGNPVLDGSDIDLSTNYDTSGLSGAPAAGDSIDEAIGKLQNEVAAAVSSGVVAYHATIATSATSPQTINASTHGCGKFVQVQVYQNGALVEADVTVDSSTGNVTIAWNGTLTAALTVVIMGNPSLT